MKKIKEAFKQILIIELDDLDEDIKTLIEQSKANNDISNYVCMENIAVLQNELFGVEGLREEIKDLNTSNYKTLDDLINEIKERVNLRIREKGLVPSIKLLIDRKIEKVKKYVLRD